MFGKENKTTTVMTTTATTTSKTDPALVAISTVNHLNFIAGEAIKPRRCEKHLFVCIYGPVETAAVVRNLSMDACFLTFLIPM